MKKHTFAGVTAFLVVGVFYSFMFLMIGNIDSDIPDLDAYTIESILNSTVSSYDSDVLIEQMTDATYEAQITADLKADGTEKITEVSLPETAVEVTPSKDETTAMSNINSTTTATTTTATTTAATTTAATTTATTTAATTTAATTTATTTAATTTVATTTVTTTAATTTAATTTATTTAATTTAATTTATTTAVTTVTTTTTAETKPENNTGLPTPKDINNGETLSYRYNGQTYEESAYDVICKIVSAEMGSSFEPEALKAQAIAAYSFMKYHNERGSSPSVAIKTPVPQVIKDAVKSVYGIGMYYGGSIAQTPYSASTGGSSASAKDVWGTDVPYLVSVECEYDVFDPHYGTKKTFLKDDVYNMVYDVTGIKLEGNPSEWFTFLPDSEGGVLDGGYVGRMLIGGQSSYISKNGNKITINGRAIRENIFNYKLKSSKFTIDYDNGIFTFTTYGYGHGVGMSQNGAELYAQYAGYNCYDILNHYYTGIQIY